MEGYVGSLLAHHGHDMSSGSPMFESGQCSSLMLQTTTCSFQATTITEAYVMVFRKFLPFRPQKVNNPCCFRSGQRRNGHMSSSNKVTKGVK
jgi:hypothetical protein